MRLLGKPRSIFWHLLTFVTFSLASVLIILILFWSLFPYKTSDVVEPIKILNENHQIKLGERIKMELHITKYNLYPVDAANSLICSNGRIYVIASIMPKGASILPKGTYIRVQDAYSLPNDAEIGTTCHFTFQNSYKVNPIRSIVKSWRSEDFEVIK